MLKTLEKYVVDNSPAILTGVATVGVLSTAFLTGRASFQAAEKLRQEEREWGTPLESNKEKVKLVWKLYIPAAVTGAMTVTCIIGANRIGARRAAALATTITIIERGFEEYREKVVENLGAKKEEKIRADVVQDRVNREEEKRATVIVGDGNVLCRDDFSGQYFESTVEKIRKAENDINKRILNNSYASLSDFYDLLGIERTGVSDELGWTLERQLDIRFDSALTKDNKPVLSVEFRVAPVRKYEWLS